MKTFYHSNFVNCKRPLSIIALGILSLANTMLSTQAWAQQLKPTTQNIASATEYDKLLKNAQALIDSGKAAQAYALLQPLEFEHAGDVRFDYLLGIAALDNDRPDMATFALERVLAVNPDYFAARMEMAHAYFQLGDLQRARTEFSALLKQNPATSTKNNIEKYIMAIDDQEAGKRTYFSGYLAGSIGRNSNVNSSGSAAEVFIDSQGIVAPLDPDNIKAADNYYTLAAGGEIKYHWTPRWGIYAAGDVRQLNHHSLKQFNALNLAMRAGVVYDTKLNNIRVSLLNGQYKLDGARHSEADGYQATWQHTFSSHNQFNAFAQSIKYRFVELLLQPNDIDQRSIGLGWQHVLTGGKSALSGSMHYGDEQDVAPIITATINPSGGRNDGGKHFSGLRVGYQTMWGDTTVLYANAGTQSSNYDKINYHFLRQREDRLHDVKLGANWQWTKSWQLRPQLSYAKNDSNIALYGYDRIDFAVTLRREFR